MFLCGNIRDRPTIFHVLTQSHDFMSVFFNLKMRKNERERIKQELRAKTSAQEELEEEPGSSPAISKDRPTGTVPSNVATPASASQLPMYIYIPVRI